MEQNIDQAFHGRARSGRTKKFYSYASASEHIGELSKGCEIFGLTKGQFSLFDILETVMQKTGPANVVIATWTAAGAETKRAKEFLVNGNIKSLRWIVDRSFQSRQPEYCELLNQEFGDCIRTIRTHAKFLLVYNDEWNFVIRTSMNFNSNPRMEDFEISEDAEFLSYMVRFVDSVFSTHTVEENYGGSSPLDKIEAFDDDLFQAPAVNEKSAPVISTDPKPETLAMFQIKEETARVDLKLKLEKLKMEEIKRGNMEGKYIKTEDMKQQWLSGLNQIAEKTCPRCTPIIDQIIVNVENLNC